MKRSAAVHLDVPDGESGCERLHRPGWDSRPQDTPAFGSLGTSPDPAVLAQRFRALSDEKRMRILDLLREGEKCVCELIPETGMAQSLLSFHLKTLRDAGLVADRKEGRWVHYSLVPGSLEGMARWIEALS